MKQFLAAILAARLWILGTPVVATTHNVEPHERGSRLERVVLRLFDGLVTIRLYLNESPENDYSKGVTILHGRYEMVPAAAGPRVGFPDETVDASQRILFFGLLRPYKGIEALIEAFSRLKDPALRLVVAGHPDNLEYARALDKKSRADSRIRLLATRIADEQLARLIDESALVVLPYRYMYNSGAALLALSRHTPVLIPETGATEALLHEVGEHWVSLFRQPLAPQDLQASLDMVRRAETERANSTPLLRRDWSVIGRLHGKVYQSLIDERRVTRNRERQRQALRIRISRDPEFVSHSKRNR